MRVIFLLWFFVFFVFAQVSAESITANCKAWFDGCNNCSRETYGAPALCTKRYCREPDFSKVKCNEYFEKGNVNKEFEKDYKSLPPEPELYKSEPVFGDEPYEIKPIRQPAELDKNKKIKDVEIIDDNLEDYSFLPDSDRFTPYLDGAIFLNVKNGDSINERFTVAGYTESEKAGAWLPVESVVGFAQLIYDDAKKSKNFALKINEVSGATNAAGEGRIWFFSEVDLSGIKAKSKDALLRFVKDKSSDFSKNGFTIRVVLPDSLLVRKDPSSEVVDRLKTHYGHFELLSESDSEIRIKTHNKGFLFYLLPIKYDSVIVVNKRTLKQIDKKEPWWTIFVF